MRNKSIPIIFLIFSFVMIVLTTFFLSFNLNVEIYQTISPIKIGGLISIPATDIAGAILIFFIGHFIFKIDFGFSLANLKTIFTMGWFIILIGLLNTFADSDYLNTLVHFPNGQIFGAFLFSIIGGLAVGFFEELVMRGGIFNSLQALFPETPGINIIVTSVLFGLLHAINYSNGHFWDTTNQIVYAFGIGFLLTTIYYLTSNILVVILLHSFVDTTNNFFSLHQTLTNQASTSSFDISSFILFFISSIIAFYLYNKYRSNTNYNIGFAN